MPEPPAGDSDRAEFERERDRCVERLRGMPLTKLTHSAELAYAASCALAELTPQARDHALPRIADRAAGDQLAVVANDLLASASDPTVLERGIGILTALRRSLP